MPNAACSKPEAVSGTPWRPVDADGAGLKSWRSGAGPAWKPAKQKDRANCLARWPSARLHAPTMTPDAQQRMDVGDRRPGGAGDFSRGEDVMNDRSGWPY